MSESRVPTSGSCARCGRALDGASAKVGDRWYGNAACARGGSCPREEAATAVDGDLLFSHPRRTMRSNRAIELQKKKPA